MKYRVFLILSLVIALFLSTPKILLFYDAPEYINIVSKYSFFNAISLGHFPIHHFFIAVLWLTTRLLSLINISSEYAGNLFALFCGVVNIMLFFRIVSKYIQSHSLQLVGTFIYGLFPAVWIINTNLMIESFLLPLFLLSTFLFIKYFQKPNNRILIFYIISIIMLLTSHIVTITLLPIHLGFGYLLKKPNKTFLFKWTFAVITAVLISTFIYFLIISANYESIFPKLNNLTSIVLSNYTDLSIVGLGRLLRNVFVTSTVGFGILTIIIFFYLLFKTIGKAENKIFLITIILLLLFGSFWFGDYMPRRIVFIAPLLAITITKYFKHLSIIMVLYLLPITLSNALLYSPNNIYYYQKLNNLYNLIPNNGVLLQTHYLRPFTHFQGDTIYIESDNWENNVDFAIGNNKRVYTDSSAILAPYSLVVGENYHPTALGTPKYLSIEKLGNGFVFSPFAKLTGTDKIILYEIRYFPNKNHNEINIANIINHKRRPNYADLFFQFFKLF